MGFDCCCVLSPAFERLNVLADCSRTKIPAVFVRRFPVFVCLKLIQEHADLLGPAHFYTTDNFSRPLRSIAGGKQYRESRYAGNLAGKDSGLASRIGLRFVWVILKIREVSEFDKVMGSFEEEFLSQRGDLSRACFVVLTSDFHFSHQFNEGYIMFILLSVHERS